MLARRKPEIVDFLEGIEAQTGCNVHMAVAAGLDAWGVPSVREKAKVLCIYSGEALSPSIVCPPLSELLPVMIRMVDTFELSMRCARSDYMPVDILQSPIVLAVDHGFRDELEEVVASRSPAKVAQNYADRLAELQHRIAGAKFRAAPIEYIEAIRLALVIYWMEDNTEQLPPSDIHELIAEVGLPQDVAIATSWVIEQCVSGAGYCSPQRLHAIDNYLSTAVHDAFQIAPMLRHAATSPGEILQTLKRLWPSAPASAPRLAAVG